jgi:hypothetical protein
MSNTVTVPFAAVPGQPGQGAFTALAASFTQPSVNSAATATVTSTSWMAVGQYIFLQGAGVLQVASIGSLTSVALTNIGAIGNAAPTTVINVPAQVASSGPPGAATSLVGNVIGPPGANLVQGVDIPANVVNPEIRQTRATTVGQAQPLRLRTQAAMPGSGSFVNGFDVIAGKTDDGSINGQHMSFGAELAPGGVPPGTNYVNSFSVAFTAGGVAILGMGGGTDGLGTGIAGCEIAGTHSISIATEGTSAPVQFGPIANAFRGICQFASDGTTGLPILQMFDTDRLTTATSGIFRLPWAASTSSQAVISQRNAGNTFDLPIFERIGAMATWGNVNENAVSDALNEWDFAFTSAGPGLRALGPSGLAFAAQSDTSKTLQHGADVGTDGDLVQLKSANTTSMTANQDLAIITPRDSNVTKIEIHVVGVDQITGDFASFDMTACFGKVAGSVVAPTALPSATDTGHSTAAGTSIALRFLVSGADVHVQGTPWTTHQVHWTTTVVSRINAPVQPPSSWLPTSAAVQPTMWLRADRGLTASGGGTPTPTWPDQGPNGNSPTIGGGTAPLCTSGTGPKVSLPSVVFSGTSAQMALATAIIPTKNFTVVLVVKTSNTAASGVFCASGNTSSGWEFTDSGGNRFMIANGVVGVQDTTAGATTGWEVWIFNSDASGNLALTINGTVHSLSTSPVTALTPSGNFWVGGLAGVGNLVGQIFEIVVWPSKLGSSDQTSLLTYESQETGLF